MVDAKHQRHGNMEQSPHLDKEYYMSDYDHGRFPFIFRMLYHIPYFYRRFNQRVVKLKIGD